VGLGFADPGMLRQVQTHISGQAMGPVTDQLAPSEWSVSEARGMAAQLRHVATTGDEYDGLELFLALSNYLDQLYGGSTATWMSSTVVPALSPNC
jgi:hypothetical protein